MEVGIRHFRYKKLFSEYSMIAFKNFTFSTIHRINRDEIHSPANKKILGVVKKSGEEVIFTSRSTVWFEGSHIRSRDRKYTTVVLNYEDIARIDKKEIATKDGKTYLLNDFRRIHDDEKAGQYISEKTIDTVSIPLSDVKEIIVLSRRKGALIGGISGFLLGGAIGLLNIIINPPPRSGKFFETIMVTFLPFCSFCGMLTGLVWGVIKGVQERYVINNLDNPLPNHDHEVQVEE